MIGSLHKAATKKVDICGYLGQSTDPPIHRLYLDPEKYDKPPLDGESMIANPHWIKLKAALEVAAHSSGSPIICNGGIKNVSRNFRCKLRNRICRNKTKKDGAPRQDDCINMDKGGRRPQGRSECKGTRTTQALEKDEKCPFHFTVKCDSFGFCITLLHAGTGCPNHANHIQADLSKLSLPMQLLPDSEKEILQSMARARDGGDGKLVP
jgi:hypothetical protein